MQLKNIFPLFVLLLLIGCNKDKEILNALVDYNNTQESKGYHFGDKIQLPKEVTENAQNITISFGETETKNLTIDPKYFTLGDNAVTFNITNKDGKLLTQDATINVFAKKPAVNISYKIVAEYPHDPKNFVQGFQLESNTIYESDGQKGESRILKYNLGNTTPIAVTTQPSDVFSEGSTIVGDKIYQLTWQNKKGYIYDKNSLKLISEFPYANLIGEGWGLTYDGTNLLLSDGSKNIFFLHPDKPSQVIKTIGVADQSEVYDKLNELEYHNGFLYANVWQKPIILKIDPKSGEVVGKFDFTDIAKQNTKDDDSVLNGIAFKGDNMLVTGKYWPKIYEIAVQ